MSTAIVQGVQRQCGSGVCEHWRQRKSQCKDRGGGAVKYAIIDHGKQRPYCKERGDSGLYEHGRQRPRCKESDGSGIICAHSRGSNRNRNASNRNSKLTASL